MMTNTMPDISTKMTNGKSKTNVIEVSLIQAILTKQNQGLTRDYDKLLNELTDPSVTDVLLLSRLQGIKGCVTELDQKRETLVGVLLKINLFGRNKAVIHEYQSVLLNLVSVHTFYLKAVLCMIVTKFIPDVKSVKGVEPVIDEEMRHQHSLTFLHLHTLLKAITQIVPMCSIVLLPLLRERYPYISKPGYVHQCYVKNLLSIAIYLPTHRQHILEMIIDNMTKLDVQCSREKMCEALQEEEEERESDTGIFDMEGVGSEEKQRFPPQAVRLDMLMGIMFTYISATTHHNGDLDWEITKALYKELLFVFDKILLPTYACNHVQFIMFYICSFKEPLMDGFLDYLWKKAKDPNTPPVFRQAAIAYIGSFLARAKYAPIRNVMAMLDLMVIWVHQYIQETADTSSQAKVQIHGTFYAICQSIFYILAFRHKEILDLDGGMRYCGRLNLQTIVTCRLNPLKFSIPVVVNTFSSIARHHQLAFCETIIERNKRSTLPTTDGSTNTVSQAACVNTLHSFFPFDPYLLPNSVSIIQTLYKEFDGNPVELHEDSSEEEEDFMETEESLKGKIGSMGMSMSPMRSIKSPKSFTDFMTNGVSAGFKHA